MNRNCLFSKAVALLLCAVLLIGYLPSIALPAAAATPDWEGEPDVVETTTEEPTEPPEGSEANPIYLPELVNNVNVPAGKTVYYQGRFSGMMMTVTGSGNYIYNGEPAEIDGVAIPVNSNNPRMPIVVAIQNTGDADAEYTISFAYPSGHQQNPEIIGTDREYTASIEANNEQGYNFKYTAEKTGTLMVYVSVPETATGYGFAVSNKTTGFTGDQQWSDSSPVNPYSLDVTADDEIVINVCTYDPNSWDYPAGNVTVRLEYEPEGPIVDENLKFIQTGLSFQEYIGLQSLISKSVVDGYDSFRVEAVQATPDGDVTEILAPTPYYTYYFYDKQILSWSMTEEVTITIYAEKDGVQYQSVPVTTSVKNLAMEKIAANYASSKLDVCRVLVDMLNYGAEVQKAFNHNASNLPNADLGSYSDLGTSETPTFNATNSTSGTETIKVVNVGMSMQSKVEFQLLFRDDVSAYEVRSTVDGVTTTIPASEFVSYYNYKYAPVATKAANMRKVHTIALYDPKTDEPVTVVYSLSVEAYAQTLLGGTYNDIAIAMMKYGDSVAALG